MKLYITTLICFLSISSIAQTIDKKLVNEKSIKGNLVHTVLFWLNNPEDKGERKAFEKGVKTLLNQCKFITSSHIGVPASTPDRPIIDKSYTYCIVVTFESIEAHDNYQIDPIHLKFVEENKDLWKKVQIYDSNTL